MQDFYEQGRIAEPAIDEERVEACTHAKPTRELKSGAHLRRQNFRFRPIADIRRCADNDG